MSNIIVAFSKRENAVHIRNVLVKSGLEVSAVCQTGAKVLQYAEMWNDGIVVCGRQMQDMHYVQLREYLPSEFEMLLTASPDVWSDGLPDGVVGLASPVKIYDLLNTIEMLLRSQERRHRKRRETGKTRSAHDREIIGQAKALLMERNNMTESEAHNYVQKMSMESGTDMAETAGMILMVMKE